MGWWFCIKQPNTPPRELEASGFFPAETHAAILTAQLKLNADETTLERAAKLFRLVKIAIQYVSMQQAGDPELEMGQKRFSLCFVF